MSIQHVKFQGRLINSSPAVFLIAFRLHCLGETVEITGRRVAPTAAEAEFYSDVGDLFIIKPDRRIRVEVKHLRINFTCTADWPYKYAFVDKAARVDGTVSAYVNVSQNYRYAAVIPRASSKEWFPVSKPNSNTGNLEHFTACPLKHVSTYQLEPIGCA